MKKIFTLFLILSVLTMSFAITACAEEVFSIKNTVVTEETQDLESGKFTCDGDMATTWAAEGVIDIWVLWELDKIETLPGMAIAFGKGDARQAKFDIEVSEDGVNFKSVLVGALSAGESLDFEEFAFPSPVKAKYVKYIGLGNSVSFWNNIAEVKFPKKLGNNGADNDGTDGVKIVSKLDYVMENALIYKANNANAFYMGEKFDSGVPSIVDGSMMIPLRATAEKMGGKVVWDEITKMTACLVNNSVMKFTENSNLTEVNGKSSIMNASAKIINDRFYVPLRDFANKTGQNVTWYDNLEIVVVSELALPELSKWELLELNDRLMDLH